MLDIKNIESLTDLPQLSSQKELTQRADTLLVVVLKYNIFFFVILGIAY